MNRYHFSQDIIAPPHIFSDDIFKLRGTNVYCKVVTFENGMVSYTFMDAYEPDLTHMSRLEFEEKFEFDHREGTLPRMQRIEDSYDDHRNNSPDYGYEDYDAFDDYDDYDHLYEDDKNN